MATRANRTISDPLGDEVQIAWARAHILLHTGDLEGANAAGIAASKATHWHRRFGAYDCNPAVNIYKSSLIEPGWMWAEPQTSRLFNRVLVNDEIHSDFQDSMTLWDLAKELTTKTQPGWAAYDVQAWQVQQAAHNALFGLDEDGFEEDL